MPNVEMEWALEKLQTLRRELGSLDAKPAPGRTAPKRAVFGVTLERAIEGFRLYEQGRYGEARDLFRWLCAQEPDQAFHRASLGLVYLAMDSLRDAERELTRSINLSSREPSAFVNRGEVFLRLGRYAEAAKDFDRGVTLLPEQDDPLAKRARLLASTAREMLASTARAGGASKPSPKAAGKRTKPAARKSAAKKPAKKPARRTGRARRK